MHDLCGKLISNPRVYTSILPMLIDFGSLLLIVCFYIGVNLCLCGCVSMCMLCMFYHCELDMTAVVQSSARIGWHPSILWDHQCYE